MSVDPLLLGCARGALALLFATAALHKLRDLRTFATAVRGYRLLPSWGSAPAAVLLAALEMAAAVALIIPAGGPAGGVLAVGLLLLYSGAIGINLARGRRDVDCGCLGPARRQPISPWLLARNAALAGIAALTWLEPGTRAWSSLDTFSMIAALAVAAALWNAAHRLAAVAALAGRPA